MFPFDVILFDVGGVLLTNGWDHRERALAMEHFGLDAADFEARHTLFYPDWERGAISGKSYLNGTVFYEPRKFSRREFFSFMLKMSQPLEDGALPVLKELVASKAHMSGKCLVGALNNEARETNEYRFREFGLRRCFDMALSSCYLGLRKPDMAIYRRALDILGRPPERILFIDDRQENVSGAVSVGMIGIRFTGAESLRNALRQLSVL
jgi:putative hydrolase of the HAD superfamily